MTRALPVVGAPLPAPTAVPPFPVGVPSATPGDLARAVAVRLEAVPGQTVLVAPCGDGDLAIGLARVLPRGARVLGVDGDPRAIDAARAAAAMFPPEDARALAWRVAAPRALPLASGAFGGACTDAGRLPAADADAILGELARAVLPGGWVVVVADGLGADAIAGLRDRLVRRNLREVIATADLVAGRKAL